MRRTLFIVVVSGVSGSSLFRLFSQIFQMLFSHPSHPTVVLPLPLMAWDHWVCVERKSMIVAFLVFGKTTFLCFFTGCYLNFTQNRCSIYFFCRIYVMTGQNGIGLQFPLSKRLHISGPYRSFRRERSKRLRK